MNLQSRILFLSFLLMCQVSAQVTANFSASPRSVCVGDPINFTDLSSASGGSISSWLWNFGDGNTSTQANPTHTYTAAGNYNITLTVSDGSVSVAEVKANFITVHPLPAVSFQTPLSGCEVPYSAVFSAIQPQGNYTYAWDFGNGQTSTSAAPSGIVYNQAGSYEVNLSVTATETSCQNDLTQTITVAPFSAEFQVSGQQVCLGTAISFTDISSGSPDTWSYDLGNGAVSSSQNPVYTYQNPGVYTVILTTGNTTTGCNDIYSMEIEVFDRPSPSFDIQPTHGCSPLTVQFTNTSQPSGGSFEWNFGNGQTFSGANPPDQVYPNNGTYSVTLQQTDENGCSSTVTMTDLIEVSPLIVGFEADILEGCEELQVNFTDTSSSPNPIDNPITSWQWDFGNGNTYSGQNPPPQLFSEGEYTVTLVVSTDGGCQETAITQDYIQVGVPPQASFTYTPTSECAKSDFEFESTVTVPVPYDEEDIRYEWDFGDGGTATDPNPTYNYPIDTGYFDVQLIVYFRGCPDTVVTTDAVYIIAPIANFSPESMLFCNETLPLEVDFNDQAILGTVNDDVEMIWDFGDGNGTTFLSPAIFSGSDQGSTSNTYTNYGTYFIKQVVHNYTTGCSDSITREINISQLIPDIAMSDDTICRLSSVFVSNNSTTSHPIINTVFDMGNGTVVQQGSVNELYQNSGAYDISMQVTNSAGCTEIYTHDDFIVLQEPTAHIFPSQSAGCVPLTVSFGNTSQVQGNGVPLASFEWTFEDGSQQTTNDQSQNVSYTFTQNGTYTTTMVATDAYGCVSDPVSVTTTLTSPTAAFDAPDVVCNEAPFSAINQSTDYVSSEWLINGQSVSVTDDLESFFAIEDTGQVSTTNTIELIVTDQNGCTNSTTATIIVSIPQAEADFSFTGSNINDEGEFVCPPVFADFTDESGSYGAITQWSWTFGDNNASTLENPSNTYVFAGTYSISLAVTDEYGCSDEVIYEDILVIGGPSGVVEWTSVGTLCEPAYLFTPSELVNVETITWQMGDGEVVNTLEPFEYTYSSPGTYLPLAIIQDGNNCSVEYPMPPITEIITPVVADFSVNPQETDVYKPMNIFDQSYGGTGGLVNWEWFFGSDSFSTETGGGFSYEWQKPGYYTIQLVVTDALGCTDTTSVPVIINADLYIPNVLTANGDGINDLFVLKEPVFTSYDIVILNRWGNVMYEAFDQGGVLLWDGKNKSGELCSEGVYFYKLIGTQYDGVAVNEHGFLTLVRE